jgi:hypothetical protein
MDAAEPVGPIARKLLKRLRAFQGRRERDFAAFVAGTRRAEALQETVAREERLAEFDPAHAIWIYVQNQVSVLSEQLTALPQMAPFVRMIGPAEDDYMPSGPPMSPLTASYFTSWAFFDAAIGPGRETIGTCIAAVLKELDAHPEFVRLIEVMQASRMGLFACDGREGPAIRLRELLTGDVRHCHIPSGVTGDMGGIWFVRLLPPPAPSFPHHVAFTTPYVIVRPGEDEWGAYLRRTLPKVGGSDDRRAYETLMKFGLEPRTWPEYVFEGYVNHRHQAIFLAGLPDVAESRPHSRANGG